MRLIALSETERVWMTEAEVLALRRKKDTDGRRLGLGFVDVTDDPNPVRAPVLNRAFPGSPTQQATVQPLIGRLSTDEFTDFLTTFSSFNTRVRAPCRMRAWDGSRRQPSHT